jgi:radical SAM protein with 4Fe4S-binding SPASM domain
MSQKLEFSYEKNYRLCDKRSIGRLVNGSARRFRNISLPLIYKRRFLREMHNPKIETAFLELTNKCNLRCKMCIYQKMQEKTGFVSRSFFQSCVDQLAEIGVGALNLHFGGESLLHPEFYNFLKYAISKRGQGKISSVGWTDNGMLFNQKIADLVVSLKVDWINFSLEGVGEVNDNIRLGSKYSVIEKNIKYLLEKRGSSTKPAILLNIVDHGKTENQKIEFYKEWSPVVDEIELLPSIRPDNTWENKNILPENIRLAPSPSFCPIPFETMVIWWDGKVAGCCFDPNLKMVLGDATKEPLKQIWEGDRFQQFRKAVLTNNFSAGSPCYKCEFWKVNFAPKDELILNGKATIQYGGRIRKIRKHRQSPNSINE